LSCSGASAASPDLASKSPRIGSTSSNFRRPPKGADSAGTLKKRMSVVEPENSPRFPQGESNPDAARALDRISKPEFAGFLRKKGERYNSWKLRYCVLAGPHFYYLKSENVRYRRRRVAPRLLAADRSCTSGIHRTPNSRATST
jgi:hypothetical protein